LYNIRGGSIIDLCKEQGKERKALSKRIRTLKIDPKEKNIKIGSTWKLIKSKRKIRIV